MTITRPSTAIAGLMLGATLLVAQAPKYGPAPGQRAASFTLQDQYGHTRTLQSLMGPKGLMLVFFRSADW